MEKQKAIMRIESFAANEGLLVLSVNDYGVKSMLRNLVQLCKEKYNSYLKLEMSPPYKPRTLNQNDKWWSMCTEYGKYLCMTKDEVALGVKYRAMEEGLWKCEEVPFSKTGIKVPVSTTKANTTEMSVLIDVLYRIAAEDGYVFSTDL